MHAVDGRRGPLVELAGKIFNRNESRFRKIHLVCHRIGDNLPEHAVAAFLEKFRGKTEQVVDVEQPKRLELQLQILVQFGQKAVRFNLETGVLFNEYAVILHFVKGTFSRSSMSVPFLQTVSDRSSGYTPFLPLDRNCRCWQGSRAGPSHRNPWIPR